MSANVVHAKLTFEVKEYDFLATLPFCRNETGTQDFFFFVIMIKG